MAYLFPVWQEPYHWGGGRPQHPTSYQVIYKIHLKGENCHGVSQICIINVLVLLLI